MPTYQYECDACGHSFEQLQSMTDGKLRKCPECGKFKLQRLIGSGSGIIFKGSGFYETDYKRTAPKTDGGGTGHTHSSSCGCGPKTAAADKAPDNVKSTDD